MQIVPRMSRESGDQHKGTSYAAHSPDTTLAVHRVRSVRDQWQAVPTDSGPVFEIPTGRLHFFFLIFHYNDTLLYNARYIATSREGGAANQLPYTSE